VKPSLVRAYDPLWPVRFRELRDRILAVAGKRVLRIEHVGGTSVPGLTAKAIIDIDVVIDADAWPALRDALEAGGWRHHGDQGVPGREAFKPATAGVEALPEHHLYACAENAAELRRHLAFRDYLRAHPAEAERLSAFKRSIAHLDRDDYQEEKAPLVEQILARALEEQR
jgi:GrpB-like predicted nucleotidyltransferase (UPF0157 family)